MFKIIVTLGVVTAPMFAHDAIAQFKEKYPFVLDFEVSHSTLSRTISGSSDDVESEVKDVTYGTITATLFPDTYDIELSYSHALAQNLDSDLYNPLGHDDDANHFSISMIPYYNKKYGGLGVFYVRSEQNSQFKNKNSANLGLYQYIEPATGPTVQQIPGTDKLVTNQSYQAKEKFSYLGLKYLLPTFEYLPKGANVFYSRMDRNSVYFANFANENRLLHMSDKGNMYGFGLQRSLDELPENRLSLHLVQLSKGKFSKFPDIDLSEYTAGVTYKAENWYVKTDALLYVAEAFSADFGGSTLTVPKHSDLMWTFHLGTSF